MNPRIERVVCWLAMLACFGLLAYAALASPARGDEPAQVVEVEEDQTLETRRAMLARSNQIRTARSLKPHKENVALMAAAQDHSRYMAKNRVMSHYVNGNPASRAKQAGFAAPYVLENIAYGYAGVDTTFRVWVASSGHYANLMSNTSDAGFGWAIAIDGTPYWCAVYGTPTEEPTVDTTGETAPSTPPAAGGNGKNLVGGFFRRVGRWFRR